MKTITYFILILISLVNTSLLRAQTTCNITGKVSSSSFEVDYFNIVILSTRDSSFIKSEVFYKPTFRMKDVSAPDFYIQISSMSMATKTIKIHKNIEDTLLNLGDIKVEGKSLKEVTVTSKLLSQSASRTVINITNSPLAQSGSAIDVLKRSPGLIVNKDNNVLVFGRGSAKIYIDGREANTSELSEISSENITKVEVIRNPSAQYDASANAVVNITTKNKAKSGYYVKHTSNFTQGEYFRYSGDLDVSMKKNHMELFSYISTRDQKIRFTDNYIRDIDAGSQTVLMVNELTKVKTEHFPLTYKIGTNLYLNRRSQLSFVYNGSYIQSSAVTNNMNEVRELSSNTLFNTHTSSLYLSNRNLFTAGYSINFDTAGQKLDIKTDFLNIGITNRDHISEQINAAIPEAYMKKNNNKNDIQVLSAVIDYLYPIASTQTKINGGAKITGIKNTSSNDYLLFSDVWTRNPDKSEHSSYKENNLAAYLIVSQKIQKFSASAGLRGEHSSITANNGISKTYFNLFPSASVDYRISNLVRSNLSYSRRIRRPSYQDLNPFLIYIDSLSYMKGNPQLQPSISHAFELSVSYREMASLTLSYTNTRSPMFMYVETDVANRNTTYVSTQNFDKAESYAVTLNLPYEMGKWTTYNSLGWEYDKVWNNSTESNLSIINRSKPMFYVYTYHSYKLPWKFSVNLTYQYNTSAISGIFEAKPKHVVNMGITKSIRENIKINLQYNDMFGKDVLNSKAVVPNMNLMYRAKYDASYVRLSISFNFGGKFNVNNVKSSIKDEMNRVKEN
ncbi:MAG TPA: outer membrane beta-barrel family protein [Bacteroidales bacterium]|nr:outer membrane beta-barrel family protein [Bacteroidales bacterium]